MLKSWDPLTLFQQGLRNSTKNMPDLKPAGLCACLRMAQYCLKISPGFLPPNRKEKIRIARMSNEIFQLLIPIMFSSEHFKQESFYIENNYLIVQADPKFLPNLKFTFKKYDPEELPDSIPLSVISSWFDPMEKLIIEITSFLF